MNSPLITILVTTRNEEKNIGKCLDSVLKQGIGPEKLELLVVDNSSSDRTTEVARQKGARILIQGPERSAQRNMGITQARGEYLIFLDADMRLGPGVLSEAIELCRQQNLDALYIPEIVTGEGWWSRVRNFERSFYNATVIDGVRFFKTKLAREIGGFDEALNGPEDWDFDRRIREKGRVGITQNPLYHDEDDFHLSKYLRKKRYYSQGFDLYMTKWGKNDSEIKKQFGVGYRFFGVFLEKGKWKKLLTHPGLATGMYFLRGTVGLACLGKILRGGQN